MLLLLSAYPLLASTLVGQRRILNCFSGRTRFGDHSTQDFRHNLGTELSTGGIKSCCAGDLLFPATHAMGFSDHQILAKCSWRLLNEDPYFSVAASQQPRLFRPPCGFEYTLIP
jgi:hypothetical protein